MINKEFIRAAFNQAASTYDNANTLNTEINSRLIERLDLLKINPKVILDVGARTGTASRALAHHYPKANIVGLDLADQMLIKARRKKGWFSKQYFVCGDTENLPLQNESVDFIFSNLAIQWCDDLRTTFKEWYRILKPNGVILFATLGPDTLKELRIAWQSVDQFTHINSFIDMHDIGDVLLHNQFSDPVMDMEYVRFTYPNLKQIFHELKASGTYNITDQKRQALMGKSRLQQIEHAYLPFCTDKQRYLLTYEIVYGHAWKIPRPEKQISSNAEVHIPVSQIKRL